MLIPHIIKTIEYIAVEGFPVIPLEELLVSLQGLAFHLVNMISLYLAVLFL